jgi:phospholipid transport system substrate-binding protein
MRLRLLCSVIGLFMMTAKAPSIFAADVTQSADTTAPITSLSAEEAQKFITETGNQIIAILANKQKPLASRKEEFRSVLRENFNIAAIGRFVLGKYWRQANDQQKEQYLQLFEDAIVESYSAQFNNYSNEKLRVLSASPTHKGGVLVKSKVLRPQGGEPLRVDWQVFQTKTGLKIHDIIVNGVSMSITQRTEYAGIIQSTGRGIDGLLDSLRQKPSLTQPNSSKTAPAA